MKYQRSCLRVVFYSPSSSYLPYKSNTNSILLDLLMNYLVEESLLKTSSHTLPETKIAPEIDGWKMKFPLGNPIFNLFSGSMLVSGSVSGDQKHGSLQIGARLGTWTHLFGLEMFDPIFPSLSADTACDS